MEMTLSLTKPIINPDKTLNCLYGTLRVQIHEGMKVWLGYFHCCFHEENTFHGQPKERSVGREKTRDKARQRNKQNREWGSRGG